MQAAGIFADAGRTDCFDADTYHVCAFNSDKRRYNGKIIDDGLEHAIGCMPIPHTVEPEPDPPPEPPVESDPDGGEDDPNGDPDGGEDEPGDGDIIEIVPGGVPASERVDTSYFDDVVFIGDSVSLKLQYYVRDQRKSDENFL